MLKMLPQFADAHPPIFDDEHDSNVWPASVATLEALGTVECGHRLSIEKLDRSSSAQQRVAAAIYARHFLSPSSFGE